MFRVPAMVVKSSKGPAMLKFYVSIKQFDMHDSINNSVIYLALDDKALVFSVEFAWFLANKSDGHCFFSFHMHVLK